MKILVVDFTGTSDFKNKLPKHIEVLFENEDGMQAYQVAGSALPDLILINYAHKPSHCRQTASAIKTRKKTAHIPIYFADGTPVENEKVKSIGSCIESDHIIDVLRAASTN